MKHIFMLSILFKSHLIRHSGTEHVFENTQRTFEGLRHSESTQRALGHSEDTQTLGGHSGTRRTLGHLEGTRALGGHSSTRVLIKALGHSNT